MNEWTIVTVIIALVGLFFTLGKPIITLNNNITKLTVTVESLQKTVDKLEAKQAEDQKRVWERLDKGSKKFDDHENRITNLERDKS
jgi:uncharacterized membrane protein (DUF106 family)